VLNLSCLRSACPVSKQSGLAPTGCLLLEAARPDHNRAHENRDDSDDEQDRAEGDSGGGRISHDPSRQGDSTLILADYPEKIVIWTPEAFGRFELADKPVHSADRTCQLHKLTVT
jgi:hypothetical protein